MCPAAADKRAGLLETILRVYVQNPGHKNSAERLGRARVKYIFYLGLPALFILPPAYSNAQAPQFHNGLVIETVNRYNSCFGAGSDLSNSNASGSGFEGSLVGWPFYFASGLLTNITIWQDGQVYDTDFLNPVIAGANVNNNATNNFDKPGTAIAFFQGHGANFAKPIPDQSCNRGADCKNPPAGATVGSLGTGTCAWSPSSVAKLGKGVCQYTSTRALLTCGAGDSNGHKASLAPYMALGETPFRGAWRGAGVGGGASLAIVHMSFGMLTYFPSEWSSLFAGLQLYEGMMVSWGDVNDSAEYGPAVGSAMSVNLSGSISEEYLNAISNITDGGGCQTGTSGANVAGGFNGCGCHFAMTLSNSALGARANFNGNLYSLLVDSPAQQGVGFWQWGAVCNYNPSLYPWSGGD